MSRCRTVFHRVSQVQTIQASIVGFVRSVDTSLQPPHTIGLFRNTRQLNLIKNPRTELPCCQTGQSCLVAIIVLPLASPVADTDVQTDHCRCWNKPNSVDFAIHSGSNRIPPLDLSCHETALAILVNFVVDRWGHLFYQSGSSKIVGSRRASQRGLRGRDAGSRQLGCPYLQ